MGATDRANAPDSELVERLKAGDEEAFETIVEHYSAQTYRVARAITGSPQDAEEVVQDVFMTIFRKIGGFEGRSAFSTWLYRITVNTAMMKVRGRPETTEEELERWLPVFDAMGAHMYPVEAWSTNPEHILMQRERREVVRSALATLPAEYRTIVALRDLQGRSSEEIAEMLGLSIAAAKSRLHRARLALRGKLTSAFEEKS